MLTNKHYWTITKPCISKTRITFSLTKTKWMLMRTISTINTMSTMMKIHLKSPTKLKSEDTRLIILVSGTNHIQSHQIDTFSIIQWEEEEVTIIRDIILTWILDFLEHLVVVQILMISIMICSSCKDLVVDLHAKETLTSLIFHKT